MPRFGPPEKVGCVALAVIGIAVLLVAGVMLRTCSGPYFTAKRLAERDPCSAAKQFADLARKDVKGWSASALDRLSEIDTPCSLDELVDLMDLPDGRHIGEGDREIIRAAVERRVKKAYNSVAPPPYEPSASEAIRAQQKLAWKTWLRAVRGLH